VKPVNPLLGPVGPIGPVNPLLGPVGPIGPVGPVEPLDITVSTEFVDKYGRLFHGVIPSPIFNLLVSLSQPGSPAFKTGFAELHPELVSLRNKNLTLVGGQLLIISNIVFILFLITHNLE
jgi:hypothetical protein